MSVLPEFNAFEISPLSLSLRLLEYASTKTNGENTEYIKSVSQLVLSRNFSFCVTEYSREGIYMVITSTKAMHTNVVRY